MSPNSKQPQVHAHAMAITPREVYYILYRHKWLILILSSLSIAAAVIVFNAVTVPYTSEAKLMVKYVRENKLPEQGSAAPTERSGDSAVTSEMEVMRSGDIAASVVDTITPGKILAKIDGGTNRGEAISLVKSGLMVASDKSDVVTLYFSHPDPEIVQPVLNGIIAAYKQKHRDIHQGPGYVDFLQKLKEEVEQRIADTDHHIADLKHQAGEKTHEVVVDIIESQRRNSELADKLRGELLETENEFAGMQQRIKEMENGLPKIAKSDKSTNGASSTNLLTSQIRDEYGRTCAHLALYQKRLEEAMFTYADDSTPVKNAQSQVAKAEKRKEELEEKYPELLTVKFADPKGPDPMVALNEEKLKADALLAKLKALSFQLDQVKTNTLAMGSFEGQITQLQREKEQEEEEEAFYSTKLDQQKVDQEIGQTTNISDVESPQAPVRELKKISKAIYGILFGGLAFAFGLPFVIEFYLDRTLKRPIEVQTRIGLPFFISIPYTKGKNGRNGRTSLKKSKKVPLLPNAGAAVNGTNGSKKAEASLNGALDIWENLVHLQPFYETLRDRLMTYFEMHNMTHKPKLVAVTSCGEGAGVTSTAAGLASSLSETGDGNVLLVNMNNLEGEAHHFYKGKLTCDLDDVLEKETREKAFVGGNLYVAKEESPDDRLPRVLPKRFTHLLPKLKASDFDYIIFDMPPISQISITPRLARFMDMVLLVIESGKTDRDVAARAAAVLTETKTHVGVVLNKNQDFGPRHLQNDI